MSTAGFTCRRASRPGHAVTVQSQRRLAGLRYLLKSLAVVLCAAAALAQRSASNFSVTGVVLDPSKTGVSGAKVSLKQAGAKTERTTIADVAGAFRFDGVDTGAYELLVEQEGFKPSTLRIK